MDEKQLKALEVARRRDRAQAKTRRRRQGEAPPAPLQTLVTEYFGRDPEALRRIAENRALVAWPEVVGAAAAAVSRAERVRGEQLVVRVRDPLWMHQLYLLKTEILRQYRERFPDLGIRDLYLRGGS